MFTRTDLENIKKTLELGGYQEFRSYHEKLNELVNTMLNPSELRLAIDNVYPKKVYTRADGLHECFYCKNIIEFDHHGQECPRKMVERS